MVDSTLAGRDAGEFLDQRANGIPILASVFDAVAAANDTPHPATHMVVGLATDGGVLTPAARAAVLEDVRLGLNVDSGLHQHLNDDAEIVARAREAGVRLRDVRRSLPFEKLHLWSGKIKEVRASGDSPWIQTTLNIPAPTLSPDSHGRRGDDARTVGP